MDKRTCYLCRLNKAFSSQFPESYPDLQAPNKSRTTKQPNNCDNNSKYEDISPNIKNVDKITPEK